MRTFLLFALATLILLPFPAAAQFGPIVPEVCRTCACGFGGVMAITQNVVNFIIALGVIVATIIIAWGGGLYILSPTNPEMRNTANKMLINAVVGMCIILSAWLIVDFVMKTLYNNGSEFGPWNTILLSGTGESCVVAKPNKPLFSGNIFVVPGQSGDVVGEDVMVSGTASHQAGAARLEAAGISISSSGNCADRRNPRCTSLDGMRSNTIGQVIALKQDCSECEVVVTGGTETGHAGGPTSHAAGYKIDLRTTPSVNAYIESLTRSGSRGSDPRYVDRCGNEYVREGSPAHWDITVTRGVCSPPRP